MTESDYAEQIRIRGLVQGVGFRPTVWRLAKRCGLKGSVWNDTQGVMIHAVGARASIDLMLKLLQDEAPPLCRIESIEREVSEASPDQQSFKIVESRSGKVETGIIPDAATCPACVADIFDSANRRYGYAFTNCTHCGPRLSIVRAIPYDRATTSMASFKQCPECVAEYSDPADRRFHAQPNACPVCGPKLWLEHAEDDSAQDADEDPIKQAARLIMRGEVVAIKGIGGIHLACDANNAAAVDTLRRRKRRYHKAFALMARDLSMVSQYARVNDKEASLLQSVAAPIVVLDSVGAEQLAPGIAPGQITLGFMLPYTPLHHLLMAELDYPIVLTSGNQSDEPQVIDNHQARSRLAGIADHWLLHDRDIVNRLDDSVARVMDGQTRLLRRARGYAPAPIRLHSDFAAAPPLLALGGELKNTFCLLQQGQAIVSQHMGDLENVPTLKEFRHTVGLYRQLFQHDPLHLVVDLHPNYLSTQWGETLSSETGVGLERVAHHHAHIAGCLAEQGLGVAHPPVLGVALDGLGMGPDGALWGGEFLKADFHSAERLGHFQPVAMLGGAKAMYEPWRNTLAHLLECFTWEQLVERYADLEIVKYLQNKPVANLQQMLTNGLNSPKVSSCGRLFDAVAAAIGVCREQASHEGQAAMEMEALITSQLAHAESPAYSCEPVWNDELLVLSWKPLWKALLDDLRSGISPAEIAARFHRGLINAVADSAMTLCEREELGCVVLSGGVFQNRILLEGVSRKLRQRGISVFSPIQVPANDGGLSLGQAAVAAARHLTRG